MSKILNTLFNDKIETKLLNYNLLFQTINLNYWHEEIVNRKPLKNNSDY